jgi:Fe2+ or Zn2+ uptake regulation protein
MRNTKTRKKLLAFLEKEERALTAKEIHEQLSEIDLATIYRNLSLFVDKGLIRELRINKGESAYEINKDDHEHAICDECGKIRHIPIDKSKIKEIIGELNDFDVNDIEVTIKGHCKK